MTTEEWINDYFKEQWEEVIDCNLDFTKLTPSTTSNSLHISEERYIVGEDEYRLLYTIGGSEPSIEKLKK